MISFELLREKSILIVRQQGALEAEDFRRLAQAVDPCIADKGMLCGLLIEAPSFPGWDSFAALIEHLRFVRDHHRNIRRVKVAPRIAAHFAHPEIKVFGDAEKARALGWLEGGNQ
jgi:hypothetical protein